MQGSIPTFICNCCTKGTLAVAIANCDGMDITLEQVNKFSYLGNETLDAEGGYDSAVMARVRCAWKVLGVLMGKGF